jgi:hypothetical protein
MLAQTMTPSLLRKLYRIGLQPWEERRPTSCQEARWGDTVQKSLLWSDFRSNRYCESFNSKLRDEFLNGAIFYTLKEANIVIEIWHQHYTLPGRTHRMVTNYRHQRACNGQLGNTNQLLQPPNG